MLEQGLKTATRAIATVIVIVAAVSACSQTNGWLGSSRDSGAATPSEPVIPDAAATQQYLQELSGLSSNDPALQAEILADSEAAARLTPNPSTTLRYALVLATPGHPGSDPRQAQSILRELMTQQALMTPAEVALATIYLNSTEETMRLDTELRQARATSDRVQRTEEAAISQQLATVEAENQQLRQELEDAEDKLEAITSIERDIRQQDQ